MDGEKFYNEFKAALAALGLSWCDMKLMQVDVTSEALRFSYGGRVFEIRDDD